MHRWCRSPGLHKGKLFDHGRLAAHKAFDPVWQQMLLPRSDAYEWLAHTLGIPRHRCHIGMMALEDCRRVSQAVWERSGGLDTLR
ncbi:zinc-finger-containing protein [Roseateles microcysteis]|uniref:zinc-finger-containing protein n=1 Tax=Roseateles microcysteis TaxID=3119057 RepID=UPI003A7F503E